MLIKAVITTVLALTTSALAPAYAQTATPAKPAPQTAERFTVPKGPHEVTQTDVTLHDAARKKDLELRVRTPKLKPNEKPPEAGFPLLVFSHGAGGSRDAFPGLQDLLASHGYVCIAATHSDSIALARRAGGGGGEGKGAPGVRELTTTEGRRKLRNSVKLSERVGDCTLILDQLTGISTLVEKAGGTAFAIDPQQIAIAGHSAGAFTTQLCAGVKIRGAAVGKTGQGMVSIGDDRFKAAVVISGQGTASPTLSETSWDAVKIPMLVFSGSLDGSPEGMGNETPATRRHPFEKSKGKANGGPAAYLVYIEGATHSAYSGKGAARLLGEKPATDATLVENATTAAVLTFLDAHIRKDAKALATLESEALSTTIPGKVEYQHK
jgi:predicted dienelactone hydrolase